jgi:hypothetical protein
MVKAKNKRLKKMKEKNDSKIDKGLVASYLKMSPEERLKANDNAMRTILELRNAFKKRKSTK